MARARCRFSQLTGANVVFSSAPAAGQSFFGVILAWGGLASQLGMPFLMAMPQDRRLPSARTLTLGCSEPVQELQASRR